MKRKFVIVMLAASLCGAVKSFSQTAEPTAKPVYAQKLVDEVIRKNPDMLDILFHVTPAGKDKNIVVASHLTKDLGEVSGDDDLGVMNTGKPLVEVQKDGVRIGVLVQLKDKQGHAIGALGLMYPYTPGQDQQKVLARSNSIRDHLAKEIKSVEQLTI